MSHNWLAPYHLKFLATLLFFQQQFQAKNKGNIKASHYWPFCEENPSVTGGFSSQRVSNLESISMSWFHHHRFALSSLLIYWPWEFYVLHYWSIIYYSLPWYNYSQNKLIQWSSSGKARNVSLMLQNLVHFHAPFFTNHVYFPPHDRPPLLKGHHLR